MKNKDIQELREICADLKNIMMSLDKRLEAVTQEPRHIIMGSRLTYRQACKLLNRSRSWLEKKTKKREILHIKDGKTVFFEKRELIKYMDDLRAKQCWYNSEPVRYALYQNHNPVCLKIP